MTYSDAIEFLYRLQLFGATLGLDTTRRLAEAAGNPQNSLRFIHVAGTNGKGSTCAMLESIYRAAGLRVGLYTSPHLLSFRERIQVNRHPISESDVVRLVANARTWITSLPPNIHPTFFEVITVIALRYFLEQRCDLVIWETGLGGRLDATNIVTPLASVITNVQLDHERWLGNTIAEIAREKAGIIKPGVPAVTAADDAAAVEVIQATALAAQAPLHFVTPCAALPSSPALYGEHQRLNAALVLHTVKLLQGQIGIPDDAIKEGLENVQWPGRFQVITRPAQTLVLDGAHNPAGAEALARAVRAQFPNRPCTLVLGILEDKKWGALCNVLAPLGTRILVVPVASPRTARPEDILAMCQLANTSAEVKAVPSLAEALRLASGDSFVLVAGSLYSIGEAMEILDIGSAAGERGLNDYTSRADQAKLHATPPKQ